jgi:hypothetical protein
VADITDAESLDRVRAFKQEMKAKAKAAAAAKTPAAKKTASPKKAGAPKAGPAGAPKAGPARQAPPKKRASSGAGTR